MTTSSGTHSPRALLTGAGGQVGIDLAQRLRQRGYDVLATDLALRPELEQLAPGVQWGQLDVLDQEHCRRVVQEFQPDEVYHLAAVLSAKGEQNPQLTYRVNLEGLRCALEACRPSSDDAKRPKFIFTSTIAVYGPDLPDPTPEDVHLAPTTMYGVSKAGGEMLGAYYSRRYGIDFRGVRFPGLLSAVEPGGGTSDYAVYVFSEGLRCGRYSLFCRPDTRIPLMHMDDGVRALIELAQAPAERLKRHIYNVAAFSPTAKELTEIARELIPGATYEFEPDPVRQGILDNWPRALDDGCAREDWSWAPQRDLRATALAMVEALRPHGE